MNRASLSQQPFMDTDYSDGEIYPLRPNSVIWTALASEPWLNCSPATQNHFLALLQSPHYFAGTIVSASRRQVELTVIPFQEGSMNPGNVQVISISLGNFRRFL